MQASPPHARIFRQEPLHRRGGHLSAFGRVCDLGLNGSKLGRKRWPLTLKPLLRLGRFSWGQLFPLQSPRELFRSGDQAEPAGVRTREGAERAQKCPGASTAAACRRHLVAGRPGRLLQVTQSKDGQVSKRWLCFMKRTAASYRQVILKQINRTLPLKTRLIILYLSLSYLFLSNKEKSSSCVGNMICPAWEAVT